jgi:hypothetical protein
MVMVACVTCMTCVAVIRMIVVRCMRVVMIIAVVTVVPDVRGVLVVSVVVIVTVVTRMQTGHAPQYRSTLRVARERSSFEEQKKLEYSPPYRWVRCRSHASEWN